MAQVGFAISLIARCFCGCTGGERSENDVGGVAGRNSLGIGQVRWIEWRSNGPDAVEQSRNSRGSDCVAHLLLLCKAARRGARSMPQPHSLQPFSSSVQLFRVTAVWLRLGVVAIMERVREGPEDKARANALKAGRES